MSTTELMTFRAANVAALPKLVCVGSVDAVYEGKVSSTQRYIVQPVNIAPDGTGRMIKHNLLYRPEWLRPGFDPNSFMENVDESDQEAMTEARSLLSVYRRNINVHNGISTLRGLAGSEDAFNTLANRLLSLPEVTIEAVQEVLTTFFLEDNEGVRFGYVLKQQQTKTEEINPETGRNVYVPENRYEIDRFFDYSEKAIRGYMKQAERNKSNMIVTFDPDTGF